MCSSVRHRHPHRSKHNITKLSQPSQNTRPLSQTQLSGTFTGSYISEVIMVPVNVTIPPAAFTCYPICGNSCKHGMFAGSNIVDRVVALGVATTLWTLYPWG